MNGEVRRYKSEKRRINVGQVVSSLALELTSRRNFGRRKKKFLEKVLFSLMAT